MTLKSVKSKKYNIYFEVTIYAIKMKTRSRGKERPGIEKNIISYYKRIFILWLTHHTFLKLLVLVMEDLGHASST